MSDAMSFDEFLAEVAPIVGVSRGIRLDAFCRIYTALGDSAGAVVRGEKKTSAKDDLDRCRDWYQQRFQRLRRWVEHEVRPLSTDVADRYYAIVANGSPAPHEQMDFTGTMHALRLQVERNPRVLALKHLRELRQVETPCTVCVGTGVKVYDNTSTWSHGAGGQSITTDVCDHCWGSGDEHRHWQDLRRIPRPVDLGPLRKLAEEWSTGTSARNHDAAVKSCVLRDCGKQLLAAIREAEGGG